MRLPAASPASRTSGPASATSQRPLQARPAGTASTPAPWAHGRGRHGRRLARRHLTPVAPPSRPCRTFLSPPSSLLATPHSDVGVSHVPGRRFCVPFVFFRATLFTSLPPCPSLPPPRPRPCYSPRRAFPSTTSVLGSGKPRHAPAVTPHHSGGGGGGAAMGQQPVGAAATVGQVASHQRGGVAAGRERVPEGGTAARRG